jgi:AraC-like DNA-binding protein
MLFLEGAVEHFVDGRAHRMRAGDAAFVPANTPHAFRFMTNNRVGRALSIDFDGSIATSIGPLPAWTIHTSAPRLTADLLAAYRAFSADKCIDGIHLAETICGALREVEAWHRRLSSDGVRSWLASAVCRVHDRETARLSTIARDVGVHPSHLSRRFRQVFGESMLSVRDRVRVEQAAHALLDRVTPISAIAMELGFCDHAHLTRAFRRAMRMTPTEFRRVFRDTELPPDALSDLDSGQRFMFRPASASGIQLTS